MPLTTRSVSPTSISVGRLPPGLQTNELECVANGTLANLVRQMSSLSRHAHHIFSEIHQQILECDKRIEKVHERNLRLQDKIDQPNYNNSAPVSLEGDQLRKAYRSNNIIDQHTLDRSTFPPALAELYERCDSPPKLHLLDPFREDAKPALKYYTDPDYFFDLWKEEMLKTNSNDKIKTTRSQPGSADRGSPIRRRKAKTSTNGIRQPVAPVQSNVVLGHYTTRNQANGDFMHFPSEYQAPQFLRNNARNIDDNLPPPPGMSLHSVSHGQPSRPTQMVPESQKSAPLATTELSNSFNGLSMSNGQGGLDFDEDDDLPPPPPPLSDHTNMMPGLISPSTSTSTPTGSAPLFAPQLTLVEPPQNGSNLPPPPMMSQKFMESILQNLKHTLVRVATKSLKPKEASECQTRIEMLFDYNMAGGKYQRSRLALNTFTALSPKATEEDIHNASKVCASIELLQTYFLVLDDIMDRSKMRRGKPCWYTHPEVGLTAINDACILDSGIAKVIHEAIPQHPNKWTIIQSISEAKFKTCIGQHLDGMSNTMEHSTWERYSQIVEHKTSHYSFYCPVNVGFLLSDTMHHAAQYQKITYNIGYLFQAQDDYLDVYGNPEITGKVGADIGNGKCTWFSCRTLEKVADDGARLKVFSDNFGQPDEAQVTEVVRIMNEVGVEEDFHEFQKTTVEDLHREIDAFPKKEARSAVEDSEVPLSLNVATTLERLNSEEEGTCSDGSVASTSTSTQGATNSAPIISSTPRAVTIARVTTVPKPTDVAVVAAAPRVASESIQVTAGTSRVPSITVDKPTNQCRYELKCGDEFYVVDVDQTRGRPFTLYKKQDSVTKPPPGYRMGQRGSMSVDEKEEKKEPDAPPLQTTKTDAALKTLSK